MKSEGRRGGEEMVLGGGWRTGWNHGIEREEVVLWEEKEMCPHLRRLGWHISQPVHL